MSGDTMQGTATGTPVAPTRSEILATVTELIGEIIGEEYIEDLQVTTESVITSDLELESIEFVALAEKLRERYGEAVEFVDWIAGMELEEIIGLTVGQVIDFVETCLT